MLTVACVLKSGGEYKPEHVYALRDGVRQHLSTPHRFVCLSDVALKCETIPLRHNWPGWFSKLELYRPALFDGPVFFMDLDSVVCGPLDDIVLGHRFTVLRNFWSPDRIGSALMAWDADLSEIYRLFCCNPVAFMAEYVTTEKWGDQGFVKFNSPVPFETWQDKHPGRVTSYRLIEGKAVPPNVSVICFGGKRRPWNSPFWKAAS